jgi:hypothetical protein
MQEDTGGPDEEEGSTEGASFREGEQLSVRKVGKRFSTQGGEPERSGRFCGRCQQWISTPVGELHFCVKAPRKIGYEWRERDIPARAKNDIVTENRPFKRGKLIERIEADGE